MYQFYYADEKRIKPHSDCKLNITDLFTVTAVRPAMWEEHCLECAAPVCFNNCTHYQPRSDGRCKRFDNGISVYPDEKACCGRAAHLKFRKWANMMTVIFPSMLPIDEYNSMTEKNDRLGNKLKKLADSSLPIKLRWTGIRGVEWLRRRDLKKSSAKSNSADAFLFHGYSYEDHDYRLIVEIYNSHTPVFKTALQIVPGENLYIIKKEELSEECQTAGNLVKVYPENDTEAELDILWCDFVKGNANEIDTDTHSDSLSAPKIKCVIWDLDETLWDGTLIETDDTSSIHLKNGIIDIIRSLDERGIIQSIASKNTVDQALPVLDRLGISEYFLYPQIHWNAKSASVQKIAELLNIGIDACALIDDSTFERNEVISKYPQVRVYDPSELSELLENKEFQVPVTDESRHRREMYRIEEKRMIIQAENNDGTTEFLKKCHLRAHIFEPTTDEELTRCFELISRTNQLNMSGKKYTEDEFRSVMQKPQHKSLAFSCEDDFGSYGIVGFLQYKIENNAVVFTEFAMSCRVAGKYVESAVFAFILDNEKCAEGCFSVVKTKKNILLRNTLEEIGFIKKTEYQMHTNYIYNKPLKHENLISVISFRKREIQ